MPVLSLRDVTKTYRLGETEVQALRGVDLEIEKGEVLAIMGPSGSGKSTVMHILGLLDTPTSGEAAIEGTGVSSLTERKRAGLRGRSIGFVFQTFNLVETLTAQGNVELPMIFQGVKRDVRAKRAAEILTKVGLHDRIRHRPSQLSGGERQRVAIARALANDPEIILADEPTGNLDSESGQRILELLADLARRDAKTVILVTHNPDAAAIADRVVTLKDGRITHERRNV
jgi:putative ABC transport system ATP-binding protein